MKPAVSFRVAVEVGRLPEELGVGQHEERVGKKQIGISENVREHLSAAWSLRVARHQSSGSCSAAFAAGRAVG